MRAFFEYIPLILFFVVYKFFDIYWATATLIVSSALQIIYFLVAKKPVPKRNLVFFALIAVFGGLTIYLHDDTFLKWKVTIINLCFAAGLVISDKFFNKNVIKELMGKELKLPEFIWAKLNIAWALFFTLCALLNWYVAFHYSQETWVNFKVFGLTILTLIFAISSVACIFKYIPKDEE